MNARQIIQDCIHILAEQRGTLDGRAEQAAKGDRYAEACEFQTLARGVGISIDRLEEMKREAT